MALGERGVRRTGEGKTGITITITITITSKSKSKSKSTTTGGNLGFTPHPCPSFHAANSQWNRGVRRGGATHRSQGESMRRRPHVRVN
jgi:hypothetical protein